MPNATDLSFEEDDAEIFQKKHGLKNFILCIAAIAPRKSQIRIIRDLKDLYTALIFIGIREGRYAKLCKKEANNKVYFFGKMGHDELKDVCAAEKVHGLASFYETPGISSLEASLAGCIIVITDRGCIKEYLGNKTIY